MIGKHLLETESKSHELHTQQNDPVHMLTAEKIQQKKRRQKVHTIQ